MAEVVETLDSAMQEIGQEVDVLINCAGITHTATILQTPNKTFQVSPFICSPLRQLVLITKIGRVKN